MRTYDIEVIFLDGTSRKFKGCPYALDAQESTYGVEPVRGKIHYFPVHTVREIIQVKHQS